MKKKKESEAYKNITTNVFIMVVYDDLEELQRNVAKIALEIEIDQDLLCRKVGIRPAYFRFY